MRSVTQMMLDSGGLLRGWFHLKSDFSYSPEIVANNFLALHAFTFTSNRKEDLWFNICVSI